MNVRSTCIGIFLVVASATAFAQQPIVIKFSHVTTSDTPKGRAADYFKQLGAVQMKAPSLSKFGPMNVKEFELFELPYLFENDEQLRKNGLPADIRSILTDAMNEAAEYNNQFAKKESEASLDAITKSGKMQIVKLTPQERAKLKKAVLPVHKQMQDRVGKVTLQAAYKDIGFKAQYSKTYGKESDEC